MCYYIMYCVKLVQIQTEKQKSVLCILGFKFLTYNFA